MMDGSTLLTCTGRTFGEEAADAKETPGQEVSTARSRSRSSRAAEWRYCVDRSHLRVA